MVATVLRTCSKFEINGHVSLPLSEYRDCDAYVLLGDPGSGKTTIFKEEAKQLNCKYITARDFITFENKQHWQNKTLFIDGLDEIRAGTKDIRTPFDAIRSKLDKLEKPKFRISCREADWFSLSDKDQLKKVSPNNSILELHLDPLTENDIEYIVNEERQNYSIEASTFLSEVKSRDLLDLVTNPQILYMLLSIISDSGEWPKTRLETYDMSCRKMLLTEHNIEHLSAKIVPDSIDTLINAAGYLCAIILISGNAGYVADQSLKVGNYFSLPDLYFDDLDILNRVSKSKLFTKSGNLISPVHRTIAEYLAAYYLRKQIEENGLPIGRVLALITGSDGVVVTELRGLFAWLTALSHRERLSLMNRDPLGIVLYGDVSLFSTEDKEYLLKCLSNEAKRFEFFRYSNWTEQPFGALGTKDMVSLFRKILETNNYDDSNQAIVHCILDAIRFGDSLPELTSNLENFVRDEKHWSRNRRQALIILIEKYEQEGSNKKLLESLLDEINDKKIQDSDDELMGFLLSALYPRDLEPNNVLEYLHAPKNDHWIGEYYSFWHHKLCKVSQDEDIIILLEELVNRSCNLNEKKYGRDLNEIIGCLLARGITSFGNSIEITKLSNWLKLSLDKHELLTSDSTNHFKKIRKWIQKHPNKYKKLIELHVDECAKSENFNYCMHVARQSLLNVPYPEDYQDWCLKKASEGKLEHIQRYFLTEAMQGSYTPNGVKKERIDYIKKKIGSNVQLSNLLSDIIKSFRKSSDIEFKKKLKTKQQKDKKEKQAWIKTVKKQQEAIRLGKANTQLMYNLATAYYGYFVDSKGDTVIDRLSNFFQGDQELVSATLEGFRKTLDADDLPAINNILSSAQNRSYYISRPFRAGLDELSKESSAHIIKLNKKQIQYAIAFYLADNLGEDPVWFKTILRRFPDIVVDVMRRYVAICIKEKKQHISGLYSLAFDEKYSNIAEGIALHLLEQFPIRTVNNQLESLEYLLKAAIKYVDHQELSKLISDKISFKSMNIAQRVYWLSAGILIDSVKYQSVLEEYVFGKTKRVEYLSSFYSSRLEQWTPINILTLSAIGSLIKILGSIYHPPKFDESGWVSPERKAAEFVEKLINKITDIPSKEATQVIEMLLYLDVMKGWHQKLRGALYIQKANRREANFSHPNVKQISKTLNNLEPSNVEDLTALTLSYIDDIKEKIRHSNTDDYKRYWNTNSFGKPIKRKYEEECRDTFLSDLKFYLNPIGVDAQPESHYADDNRADIKISFGGVSGFSIPVEIKCNDNRELWYAIDRQLQAKYLREPEAQGYGIYLVFWFGSEFTPPPPHGVKPKNSSELEKRLVKQINDDNRFHIFVRVINCEHDNG